MNDDNNTTRTRFLRWAMAIAVILFVVGTGAITSLLWWKRSTHEAEEHASTRAKGNNAMANWSAASFSIHTQDGVYQTSQDSWSIKGGRAFMQVRRKSDASLEYRFAYPFNDLLPPETIALVRTRWNLSQLEKLAGEFAITTEQLAALKAVSPATDIPVAAPDREELRGLFENYLSAEDKAATEKALIEAVAAVDANYYDRTRERIDGIAAKVKGIFNEEQLAALSVWFGPLAN